MSKRPNLLEQIYQPSLALLNDFYQVTMAHGYWKAGIAKRQSAFHLFFRENPFKGGFTIAAGLEGVIDFLENFSFSAEDIAYLAELKNPSGKAMFEQAFLAELSNLKLSCSIDAIPEGSVVFPMEPLLRIQGPILQCQLLETPLLNLINFQTLVATKAARICLAAENDPVLEFGLRRAQGIDGGLSASRAAYIGGCAATSNVLAGKFFNIPVRGTHAHSWVMAYERELDAFNAWAEAMPENCVFLVDTYDTLNGVRNAIQAGKKLRRRGHEMLGIRLDSGDLAYLSIEARKLLDQAGFPNAKIVASNDLDEHIIATLKDQGAKIDMWGVGTRLATAYEQPALGCVYKLSALENERGAWEYKLKLSEQTIKVSTPGTHQVRRFHDGGEFVADAIYDLTLGMADECLIVDPADHTRRKAIEQETSGRDLLVPIFRKGIVVYQKPDLLAIRDFARNELEKFHPGIKRFVNPHQYPVGLEEQLHDLKTRLVLQARGYR